MRSEMLDYAPHTSDAQNSGARSSKAQRSNARSLAHHGTQRAAAVALLTVTGLFLNACSSPAASEDPSDDNAASTPAVAEFSDELTAELQAAVESVMNENNVPGAVAGVWVPGQGEWTAAIGVADLDSDTPVSLDMSWPIRSITKSYTVTLLLQLADEGELSLDDTLEQYVPGITNGDQITLLELANMSSGIAEYVNEEFVERFDVDPQHVFTIDELNQGLAGLPAQFAPGTEYLYTNSNTNLIAAVIEKVTGMPYADVLQKKILTPVGLENTSYTPDVADWTSPHAKGYIPDPDSGELVAQEQNPSILGPAGAMVSTLEDGHMWAMALGSGVLLRGQTQALRLDGHEIPTPPYDLYGAGLGQTDGWVGHNGEGIGYTAATFYHQPSGSVIVVYMNASNMPDYAHPADQAFRALAKVLAESGM